VLCFKVVNDIRNIATCYHKKVKRKKDYRNRRHAAGSSAKRQTPSRQTFNYLVLVRRARSPLVICGPMRGRNKCQRTRPACVIESSNSGRSQLSRVVYKCFGRLHAPNSTGPSCSRRRAGCWGPKGLMCRDRVRCWTRPGLAPWRRRCGRSLCRLLVYHFLEFIAHATAIILSLPVSSFWKASSTLLASKAEVSMKLRPFSLATKRKVQVSFVSQHRLGLHIGSLIQKSLAVSVATALRCLKSLLFPTSMITMFVSA
jgi:hypothetical protein